MTIHKHIGIVFLIFLGYYTIIFISPVIGVGFTFCPIKNLTGVDCPSCHLGKASTLLFSGNLSNAMKIHALVLPINLLIIFYCAIVINSFLTKRKVLLSFFDRLLSNNKLISALGGVLIINWIISLI